MKLTLRYNEGETGLMGVLLVILVWAAPFVVVPKGLDEEAELSTAREAAREAEDDVAAPGVAAAVRAGVPG